MKFTLALLAILSAIPINAQDLPDKPIPTVRVKLVDDISHQRVTFTLPVKHRTVDKTWILLTLASAGVTVLDIENTRYCLRSGDCFEADPLYGKFPSRARLWSISGPILAMTTYLSWRYKRSDDAALAFGAKTAWTKWWIPQVSNIATHAVGVAFTIKNTGK